MTGVRAAAVAALVELAVSASYADRADAGCALASFAEHPAASDVLVRLVVDEHDTLVTLRTATALLRRHDRTGLLLVARALEHADEQQNDWIASAVDDVFGTFAADRDEALDRLRDAGAPDHAGRARLVELLTDLDPPLRPA